MKRVVPNNQNNRPLATNIYTTKNYLKNTKILKYRVDTIGKILGENYYKHIVLLFIKYIKKILNC